MSKPNSNQKFYNLQNQIMTQNTESKLQRLRRTLTELWDKVPKKVRIIIYVGLGAILAQASKDLLSVDTSNAIVWGINLKFYIDTALVILGNILTWQAFEFIRLGKE